MQTSTFTVTASDGLRIHVNEWLPEDDTPRAIVQIAHGMAEHADRYEDSAHALTEAGFAVIANDHRGHKRTAGSKRDYGYLAEQDGFALLVSDLAAVTAAAKERLPGLPVVLLGHSMGSFISRAYAVEHGREITALVLSGTSGHPGALAPIGQRIADTQARLFGARHRSGLMDKLTFGQYNAAFKPTRTDFDWLSRDPAVVDAYVADEWAGGVFTASFYRDLVGFLVAINDDGYAARTPKQLPILVLSGDKDPVGANGKGVTEVAERYRRVGVDDVTLKLYPEGRHEMLNETNRDEVTRDILAWIDAHLSKDHI